MDALAYDFVRLARRVNGLEPGFLGFRIVSGPRVLSVVPLLFGAARLCLGPAPLRREWGGEVSVNDSEMWRYWEVAWDYLDSDAAMEAMASFESGIEPKGWVRKLPVSSRALECADVPSRAR